MDLPGFTTLDEVGGEDSHDDVPKYYQKTPLAQTLVDKCKDIPLLGLQYVLEVRQATDMTLDTCYYICVLCSKKMNSSTLVAHVKSVPHRLRFSEIHCSDIHKKYGSLGLKQWTATLVKEFTMAMIQVEVKMGRHKFAVAYEKDMSSVLTSIKQKISDISELSKHRESSSQENQEKKLNQSSAKSSLPGQDSKALPTNKNSSVILNQAALPREKKMPTVSENNVPIPPTMPTDRINSVSGNQKGNGEWVDPSSDDVILVSSTEKRKNEEQTTVSGSRFQKRNFRPKPHSRRRSQSPALSPPRGPHTTSPPKSPRRRSRLPLQKRSRSPPSKRVKRNRYSPSPAERRKKKRHSRSPPSQSHSRSRSRSRGARSGRHRSRSRSPSRHQSPQRRGNKWPRRNPMPQESEDQHAKRLLLRKIEDFRVSEFRLINRHKHLQEVFTKEPESHPKYRREWKNFWERRCQELQDEGRDPFHHDFKTEWAAFWHHRMKLLMDIDFKTRRDDLLQKLKMKDPDINEDAISGGTSKNNAPETSSSNPQMLERDALSRIDRSPSPWEEDSGVGKAKNPSPPREVVIDKSVAELTGQSGTPIAKIFEEQFSVIGTLKLLNELEDQLGSFGPAISTLLEKAVEFNKKGGEPMELFKDPDNLVLVRYAREKLSSQISAGILGVASLVRTQMAVERAMWLQSQAEKLSGEEQYLGLDISVIARATLGRDTLQIARFIAQHLLHVGKSNASEKDLQSILFAVSAAHTKMIVEQVSTHSQNVTLDIVKSIAVTTPSSTIDSAAVTSQKAEPLSSQATNVAKPPLFPSTVPSDNTPIKSNNDKTEEETPKSSGLSILQSAYDDTQSVDMDKLSLEDLRSLLANFRSLSTEEQEALTKYLKKLEATDSKKVMKLREEMRKNAKTTKVTKPKSDGASKPCVAQDKNVVNASSSNMGSSVDQGISSQQPFDAGKNSIPFQTQPFTTESPRAAPISSSQLHQSAPSMNSDTQLSLDHFSRQKPPSPLSLSQVLRENISDNSQEPRFPGSNFDHNVPDYPAPQKPFQERKEQEFSGQGNYEQRNPEPNRPACRQDYVDSFDQDPQRFSKPMRSNDSQMFGNSREFEGGDRHRLGYDNRPGPPQYGDQLPPHPQQQNDEWYRSRRNLEPSRPGFSQWEQGDSFGGRPGMKPPASHQPYQEPW